MDSAIEKVSIIVSKGSLEGIYPALIMANGARAEGEDADDAADQGEEEVNCPGGPSPGGCPPR